MLGSCGGEMPQQNITNFQLNYFLLLFFQIIWSKEVSVNINLNCIQSLVNNLGVKGYPKLFSFILSSLVESFCVSLIDKRGDAPHYIPLVKKRRFQLSTTILIFKTSFSCVGMESRAKGFIYILSSIMPVMEYKSRVCLRRISRVVHCHALLGGGDRTPVANRRRVVEWGEISSALKREV